MVVKSKVCWVGAPESDVYVPKCLSRRFASKQLYFYKKCIFGALTLNVGDFVLITCAGSVDSDSPENCEIARILHLYQSEDDFQCDDDPYQAIVQWYSRPYKIPHRLFDNDTVCIDFNVELIEDHRAFDPVVSIDSIVSKCVVVCGDPIDSANSLMPRRKSVLPTFVCRYKIVKVGGSYLLLPLNVVGIDQRTCSSSTPGRGGDWRKTPQSSSTRKSSSKKPRLQDIEFVDVDPHEDEPPLVSPIKIVKNSIVKRTVSDKKNLKTPGKGEVNGNYLLESPDIKRLKSNPMTKLIGARRNLNQSLEANSTADSDALNYSIIQDSPSRANASDLKIKLRLSETQKESNSDTPNKSIGVRTSSRRSKRLSTDTSSSVENAQPRSARKRSDTSNEMLTSPSKKMREDCQDDYPQTPSTKSIGASRRKSILKTPTGRQSLVGTPRRNIQLSNIVEEVLFNGKSSLAESNRANTPRRSRKINYDSDGDSVNEEPKTLKGRGSRVSTPNSKSNKMTPTQKMRLIRSGAINPTMETREEDNSKGRKSDFQIARERLHVSAVPNSLPCREKEFQNIYTFLEGKLQDQCGGCMYVSGVPGTGKTATVTAVIRALQRDAESDLIPEFDFIEINGMRLTEPRQAYVQINKQITGKTVSWEHAHALLDKRFTTPGAKRQTTILLVDELDILCNKRQDVVYNLLDWPTKSASRLVVVTIANTMDLPERMLMSKVTSRLGLTRLTFQPYSYKQLQEIVTARLSGSEAFKNDAVQLVARKVAAVSGDARRALDICRRATEVAEETAKDKTVSMLHVQNALNEMIATLKVQAIRKCSKLEKLFLQAVAAEVARTGIEETTFLGVYSQLETIAAFMGAPVPVPGRALQICCKLGAERLLICEHSRTDIFMKILLNVSSDDIYFALQAKTTS